MRDSRILYSPTKTPSSNIDHKKVVVVGDAVLPGRPQVIIPNRIMTGERERERELENAGQRESGRKENGWTDWVAEYRRTRLGGMIEQKKTKYVKGCKE